MTLNLTLMVLAFAFLAPARLSAVTPVPADEPTKVAATPLAAALEDWIARLEKDDAGKAAEWAADESTAKEVKAEWDALKRHHKEHDYRKWIDGRAKGVTPANAIGDAKSFTVGGHAFGHLHVFWSKTHRGWRVSKIWMCR